MTNVLALLGWAWVLTHLAQIAFAVWAGIADGSPLSAREEQLLFASLVASLPSILGVPLIPLFGTAGALPLMPLLAINGAIALLCVLIPPWRGHAWQAFASRLCAVAPPWAALYVIFQAMMGI